ncbi:MAG: hypothetical protein ACLGSA_01675 [Acidobacteriota bacterium]
MSERIDDPTFKANDYAINKVYGQDEFSFGGHIYEKSGGSTFLQTDQVPSGAVEVHPNAAAELDAKRLDDATKDYKRQEYLRKRDEWHNTPDTPGGMELEHRHDAPPPDPNIKPVADFITDVMTAYTGGIISKGVEGVAGLGAAALGLPKAVGATIGKAAGDRVESIMHDGWYSLSPHKDV